MKLLFFVFPQLQVLMVAVLLLLSVSKGNCRKTMVENVSSREEDSVSATVFSSDYSKVAEVFHFHLDYVEAGPNFNGKSGLPFPTPPPSSSLPPRPPPPPPPEEA